MPDVSLMASGYSRVCRSIIKALSFATVYRPNWKHGRPSAFIFPASRSLGPEIFDAGRERRMNETCISMRR